MADERIDIEVIDKVAKTIRPELLGIGAAATNAYTQIAKLKRELGISSAKQYADTIKTATAAINASAAAEKTAANASVKSTKATNENIKASKQSAGVISDRTKRLQAEIKAFNDLAAAEAKATAATKTANPSVGRGFTAAELAALSKTNYGKKLNAQAYIDGKEVANEANKAADGITRLGKSSKLSSLSIREMVVIMREAGRGDFSRMAGSVSVLAQSFDLLKYVFTPVGLGIAAVAGAMIVGTVMAASYQNSITKLTGVTEGLGRTSGITADQLLKTAGAAAETAHISVSSAREQAEAYIVSGAKSADVVKTLIEINKDYAYTTGTTSADATKALAAAMEDPAKSAEELNTKLGFLNDTQLTQIKQLVDSNDKLGAQRVFLDALKPSLIEATSQTYGLAGAWQTVSTWASNAANNMSKALAGYAGMVPLERMRALQEQRDKLTKNGTDLPDDTFLSKLRWGNAQRVQLSTLDKQIADTAKEIAQAKKTADEATKNAKSAAAGATARSLFPDSTTLDGLMAKQKVLLDGINSGANDSAESLGLMRHAYEAVTDTINRVTDANKKYITSEERAHQIAVLQARVGATKDKRLKGELTTQIAMLRLGDEVITNKDAQTRAEDAGRIVADRAGRANHALENAAKRAREALEKTNRELATELKLLQNPVFGVQGNINARIAQVTDSLQNSKAKPTAKTLLTISKIETLKPIFAEMNRLYETGAGTLEKYNATVSAVAKSLKAGDISQTQANMELNKAKELYENTIDPLRQYSKGIDDQTKLLGFYGRELEVQTLAQQKFNEAVSLGIAKQGDSLSPFIADARKQIAGNDERSALGSVEGRMAGEQIRQLQLQIDAYKELGGASLEAANAIRDLRIAQNELAIQAGTASWQTTLVTGLAKVVEGFKGVKAGVMDLTATFMGSFADGVSNSIGRAIVMGDSLRDSLRQVGQTILTELISGLVKLAIQFGINQLISASLGSAALATTAVQATAAAAMWAPAAAFASLATLGTNSIPAMAALTSTTALAGVMAMFSGVGFQKGGYTGDMPAHAAVGTVHGREYVMDAATTARIGVPALDALRSGRLNPGPANDNRGAKVTVINNANADVQVRERSDGELEIMVDRRIEAKFGDTMQRHMSQPNSKTSQAVSSNFKVRRNR